MKKEQTQTKRNHQSKEEEATRQETKRKKRQAQTERSHRRKEEEATRNRNTKRTESHTFKGASRKPQLKDCKLKQDASTKQKKKTRHEIDLRGFSHEAAVWKVLRRKENESKLKWKKNKLKQNAITNQKKKKLHERKLK